MVRRLSALSISSLAGRDGGAVDYSCDGVGRRHLVQGAGVQDVRLHPRDPVCPRGQVSLDHVVRRDHVERDDGVALLGALPDHVGDDKAGAARYQSRHVYRSLLLKSRTTTKGRAAAGMTPMATVK